MDYSFFFNHLSLVPTVEKDKVYSLLLDSFTGVLELCINGHGLFLCFDEKNGDNYQLDEGFTYGDFKNDLSGKDAELFSFINELEDKSPGADEIYSKYLNTYYKK